MKRADSQEPEMERIPERGGLRSSSSQICRSYSLVFGGVT